MLLQTKPQKIPSGLIRPHSGQLRGKLDDFIAAGADDLHLVFDFDRTLTMRHPHTDDDITSWHILRQHLPPESEQKCLQLYDKYRPLEIAGTLTEQDAYDWSTALFDIVAGAGTNLLEVERDFISRASIRPDTLELFELCRKHDIPTVILSAGVKDVIDIWCRAYGIKPTLTLSTALQTDAAGTITGWDRSTLVHVLNKAEADHPELTAIRSKRPKAIVVGDSLHDAAMAQGTRDVLRIRLHDRSRGDAFRIRHIRRRTFEEFDAMVETGSLQPVAELLRTIVGD